jgi:Flp pilus assembly protein TadG
MRKSVFPSSVEARRARSRLSSDERGAVFVETALTLSVVLMIVFGSIDLGLMFWQWNAAAKAAHLGTRVAVTVDPVAEGITTTALTTAGEDTTWKVTLMGSTCIDEATGDPRVGGPSTPYTTYCPTLASECAYYDSNGVDLGALTCTNGFIADEAAFERIAAPMKRAFPLLDDKDIRVVYQTNGIGFVGRPNGLIMNVSVSIRCKTFDLLALDSLAGLVSPGNCGKPGFPIPAMTTTMPSEDMETN